MFAIPDAALARRQIASLLASSPVRTTALAATISALCASYTLPAVNAATFPLYDISVTGWTGDVVCAAGNVAVTSAAGKWTAADIGKEITIPGAGVAGAHLVTEIADVTSATAATLATAPSTAGTFLAVWGHPIANFSEPDNSTRAAVLSASAVDVRQYKATGNGKTDDTAAVQAALRSGNPIRIPAGCTFKVTSVTMGHECPALLGDGPSSVLKVAGDTTALIIGHDQALVHNLRVLGSGIASGFTAQTGIDNYKPGDVVGSVRGTISNVIFEGLAGRGLRIAYLSAVGHREGNLALGCHFEACLSGLFSDDLGEYQLFSGCTFHACTYGARVAGGNLNLTGCKFSDNVVGINLVSGINNSHGVAVGCQFNHNAYPLDINGITYGFTFDGCTFYDGTINLVNTVGVHIRNGQLDVAAYSFDGSVGTVISGNLMPYGYANAISNNVLGHGSRTVWLNNRDLEGRIRPFGWGATLIGGYSRADYAGGAAQTIATGTTVNLKPQTITANFTAANAAYTLDAFYDPATGAFACKGYGDARVRVKLNVLITGAGNLGLTLLTVKVDGVAKELVPYSVTNGLAYFMFNGEVHMDNAQALTFALTNGSGADVVIAGSADSWIEVEGL